MSEEPKVEGIRDLPGPHVNDAADRIGDLAQRCELAVMLAVERGIVIELFGFPIPIRLGPKPPTEESQ